MFDLVLDPTFFQMDVSCLPFWKSILDSLMTYDNTTFRELMGRVSLTQTGGLNIFTSREQEYEQRALLLKRLAFVIFCSELDQYHKYMPEIQGEFTAESIFDWFFSLSSLTSRTTGQQSTIAICCSGGSGFGISMFPCTVAENVSRSCNFFVADHHC